MTEETKQIIPLTLASPGREVILKAITGGRRIRSRLTDMGLTQGMEFTLLQNMRTGPCVICVGNSRIALGRGLSDKILVTEKE